MVSDHRAFFIEKREVNDKKKLKGEDLWNNDWVLYGLPCFPNIETNLSFKKRKKEEIEGISIWCMWSSIYCTLYIHIWNKFC